MHPTTMLEGSYKQKENSNKIKSKSAKNSSSHRIVVDKYRVQ